MYKYESKCIVCGEENVIQLRTKENEPNMSDYFVINKNDDNTYKCEVHAQCKKCKIKHRQIIDIDLEKFI